eukprot:TRINITY_DN6_c1_g1_i1.p1 TRINITY_DN6_c1_g1~~TRINITY_DN6_c1_g1_i1.p1  ORF type:complete len:522 (-),score=266.39 TRINITY_DN6_c1_g1_i1:57-1622(-)
MLVPKKNRLAVYKYIFNEGVLCAQKDFHAEKHTVLDVPNLQVIKLMQSMVSRGYVKESFNWQWFYWFLTNEGIQYLREYLGLSEDVIPATLKKKPSQISSSNSSSNSSRSSRYNNYNNNNNNNNNNNSNNDERSEIEQFEIWQGEEIHSFDNMDLNVKLLEGIYGYGFERPSTIQKRAIKPLISGRDIIAQAQSGTGKTATFAIGILQQIDCNLQQTQALIIAPTRELAQQSADVVTKIGQFLGAQCLACIGGRRIQDDVSKLSQGVHVVVGTPGRVLDMVKRRALRTQYLKIFVLDEADEMLSLGFKEQIHDLFKSIPNQAQCALFSATMPPQALEISKNFMRNPMRILVKQEELTLEGIRQFKIELESEQSKFDTLCDLYETLSITSAIIFCNSRRTVNTLTHRLTEKNFAVSSTHSELSQAERESIMREFRNGKSRILISTDLLARGIDVQEVSLVINYDLPRNYENYLHRIGRSGRFGRKGVAINFVAPNDNSVLKEIEKYYSTEIAPMPADVANFI